METKASGSFSLTAILDLRRLSWNKIVDRIGPAIELTGIVLPWHLLVRVLRITAPAANVTACLRVHTFQSTLDWRLRS